MYVFVFYTDILRYFVELHAVEHADGLVQDRSNSSALAMELLQSCTKPLMYSVVFCCALCCFVLKWEHNIV